MFTQLWVTDISKSLTFSVKWLYDQNSKIDWTTEQMRFRDRKQRDWIRKTLWVSWNSHELAAIETLSKKYDEFRVIFEEKIELDALSEHKSWNYEISLEEDKILFKDCTYELFEKEQNEFKKYLKKNLDKQFIRYSTSSVDHLILLAKKQDEELQLCVRCEKVWCGVGFDLNVSHHMWVEFKRSDMNSSRILMWVKVEWFSDKSVSHDFNLQKWRT